jgi:hypothetical protein
MFTVSKQIGSAALVISVALGLLPTTAPAQMMMQGRQQMPVQMPMPSFRTGPTVTPRQIPSNQGMTGQVSPAFAAGLNNPGLTPFNNTAPANSFSALAGLTNPYATLSASPYGANASSSQSPYGGSGYGSSYYESVVGGYLRGSADIVTSQGKWMTSLQQASLLQEQNRQALTETRRKYFDEALYERQKTPTFEQERERVAEQDLRRSLNDPPISEILSGQALNAVLAHLAKRAPDEENAPAIRLDKDVVRHINVTGGQGNMGLLRNEGRLSWPLALRGDAYKADRALVSSLAAAAVNQAMNGRVDAGTLKEMAATTQRLHEGLTADAKELTAAQYSDASRFLGHLDDALKALARPDAGDYFTRKYTAQGRTVAELVKHMTVQGLTFAPAVAGDGAAYSALHRALVSYDASIKARVAADR